MSGKQFDPTPLLAKLDKLGRFVDITPSLVGYRADGHENYYLTIDFWEHTAASLVKPFAPKPKGEFEDPDNLIRDWQLYESKVLKFSANGTLSTARAACPAFHCLGDERDVRLRELANHIDTSAPVHIAELVNILVNDRRERNRGAAAYLIAYGRDGAGVVSTMVHALHDPSALVRNNSMRVLSDIARYHPEVEIPLVPVVSAMLYPTTLDRNKGAAVVDSLLSRGLSDGDSCYVIATLKDTLLAMLKLRQPNNHDFAYSILKKLSHQDFGEFNSSRWELWLNSKCRTEK